MANDLEFAIIGYQRTGTTVLTHMLNSSESIYTAREIFHPGAAGIESYSEFYAANRGKTIYTLSDRWVQYGRFIDMLRRNSGKNIIGVNIKYASCHHLDDDWRELCEEPRLFQVFRSRGVRIIHAVRRNVFRLAISNALASTTGLWHLELSSSRHGAKIDIDPGAVVNNMRSYERELGKFNDITKNYPSIMEIEYESLFDGDVFCSEVLAGIATFLGVKPDFDRQPRLKKIMPRNWGDAFSNSTAIEQAVADAGYEHMLT